MGGVNTRSKYNSSFSFVTLGRADFTSSYHHHSLLSILNCRHVTFCTLVERDIIYRDRESQGGGSYRQLRLLFCLFLFVFCVCYLLSTPLPSCFAYHRTTPDRTRSAEHRLILIVHPLCASAFRIRSRLLFASVVCSAWCLRWSTYLAVTCTRGWRTRVVCLFARRWRG